MAGVSIATVSHVINRTRYVSPELEEKVLRIMRETGYVNKLVEKERKLKVGRESEIIAVLPNVNSTIYRDMVSHLRKLITFEHPFPVTKFHGVNSLSQSISFHTYKRNT